MDIEATFAACNSTVELAEAAIKLRDAGENVSLINKARMLRLKQLVSTTKASYKRIPKSVFSPSQHTEPISTTMFDASLLDYPTVGVTGETVII